MAPKAKNSDQALIELFLDMVAAERGGAKNTLAAYARDLEDFSRSSRPDATARIAKASTDDLRAYLGSLAQARLRGRHRWRGGSRPSASSIAFSTPRDAAPTIRPRSIEGPKRGRTLPKVLSIAEVDRLLAQARAGLDSDRTSRSSSGCAPRGSPA